ncbi:MAG: FRG domain-containing protein [Solirubrobacteraceae bacterium]
MIETVGSWRELDEAIADTRWCPHPQRVHSTLVWRGLARSSYSNVSSLARLSADYPQLERHLVRNFRKYAHREAPGPTMWDWLSLAQHHGLPTRLLDWTFSPLVALHFATASWADDEAILLAVDCEGAHELLPGTLRDALRREGSLVFTTQMLAAHAEDLGGLDALTEETPFVLFFEPPSLDERIVNQAAVLSAISDARCHMEDWLEGRPELWRAWRIPPSLKAEVRERLDQAHVNERVLLPGLDGLAAWLRRYYSPRRATGDTGGGGSMAGEGGGQQEGSMAGPPAEGP